MTTPIDSTTKVDFKAHGRRDEHGFWFYTYLMESKEPVLKDGVHLAYNAMNIGHARQMHAQSMQIQELLAARKARIRAEFAGHETVLYYTETDLHMHARNKRLENISREDLKDPTRPWMRADGAVFTGRDGRSIVLKHRYHDAFYIIPA